MIELSIYFIISSIWVYFILGLLIAKLASETPWSQVKDVSTDIKLKWFIGNILVVIFWLPLVCIGGMKGLAEVFFPVE